MKKYIMLALKSIKEDKKRAFLTIISVLAGTFVIGIVVLSTYMIVKGLNRETVFYSNYDVLFKTNVNENVEKIIKHKDISKSYVLSRDLYCYSANSSEFVYQNMNSDYKKDDYSFTINLLSFRDSGMGMWHFCMLEGRLPSKEMEMIIPKEMQDVLPEKKGVGDTIDIAGRSYSISGIYSADKSSCRYTNSDFFYVYAYDSQNTYETTETADNTIEVYTKIKDHSDLENKGFAMNQEFGKDVSHSINYEMESLVYYQTAGIEIIGIFIAFIIIIVMYCSKVITKNALCINMPQRIRLIKELEGASTDSKDDRRKGFILFRMYVLCNIAAGIIGICLGLVASFYTVKELFRNKIKLNRLPNSYVINISVCIILIAIIIAVVTYLIAMISAYRITRKIMLRDDEESARKVIFKRDKLIYVPALLALATAVFVYMGYTIYMFGLGNRVSGKHAEYYEAKIEVENNNITKAESEKIKKQLLQSAYFETVNNYKCCEILNCVKLSEDENKPMVSLALQIYSEGEIEDLKQFITDGAKTYDSLKNNGIIIVIPKESNYSAKVGNTFKLLTDKKYYDKILNDKRYSARKEASDIATETKNQESIDIYSLIEQTYAFSEVNIAAVASKSLYEDNGLPKIIVTQEYFNKIAGGKVFEGYNNIFSVNLKKNAGLLSIQTYLLNLDDDAYMYFYNNDKTKYQTFEQYKVFIDFFVLACVTFAMFLFLNVYSNCKIKIISNKTVLGYKKRNEDIEYKDIEKKEQELKEIEDVETNYIDMENIEAEDIEAENIETENIEAENIGIDSKDSDIVL